MIGTEFLKGQGLGNRLFCYITARCLAQELGTEFGTAGQQYLDAPFLQLDLGRRIPDPENYTRYDEQERRLYLKNSPHDMVHGCYTAGADPVLLAVIEGASQERERAAAAETGSLSAGTENAGRDSRNEAGSDAGRKLQDHTLIYGNLQAEAYFSGYHNQIREWLKVRPEFDSYEYSQEDLCVINIRGGEYTEDPALFLKVSYFRHAMKWMRKQYPGIRFMTVTDDETAARKLLPEVPAHHFDPAKDYVTLKNAKHLIVSNSSFAFFPAYTSETVHEVIAPKYWARHNVSDGYWASEQNIYSDFLYMDRKGRIFTARECRKELAEYPMQQKGAPAPWKADDPEVLRIGRRNERIRLRQKAAARLRRMVCGRGQKI